jgi:hypothetical protein
VNSQLVWKGPVIQDRLHHSAGHDREETSRKGEDPSRERPRIEVEDRWKASLVCLHQGLMPDGEIGPYWSDCAWQNAEDGMDVGHDGCYQWVLCRDCGLFGCEFMGRAERLSCRCQDPDGKDYNCGDPRLLAAYKAARWADLGVDDGPEFQRATAAPAVARWGAQAMGALSRALGGAVPAGGTRRPALAPRGAGRGGPVQWPVPVFGRGVAIGLSACAAGHGGRRVGVQPV